MNKTKGLLLALLVVASSARANVYVSWSAGAGFVWSGSGDPLMNPGESVLAQLIWSSDDIANAATFGNANYVSGNDFWLADFIVNANDRAGGEYGWFDNAPIFNDNGGRPNGGYIYARVFESLTPQVGDWYYAGPVEIAINKAPTAEPPDAPQVYAANRDGVNGDPINGAFGAQVVPVPEPGTIALFALGVATLAASRRRRKAA